MTQQQPSSNQFDFQPEIQTTNTRFRRPKNPGNELAGYALLAAMVGAFLPFVGYLLTLVSIGLLIYAHGTGKKMNGTGVLMACIAWVIDIGRVLLVAAFFFKFS